MVQREILQGHKVKYDIGSPDFEKKKKRSTTLKLIRIRNESKRKVVSRH
jgi:hypothetical protein